MRKKIKYMVPILVLIAIIGGILFSKYLNRTQFPQNDQVGNSAGNLFNKGLFCERNGVVYFSNPKDNFALYSMDSAGTNFKKLSSDVCAYINADDHYLYYTRNNASQKSDFSFLHIQNYSLCRLNQNGKNELILDSSPSLYSSQFKDYIYYIHYDKETASTLYKVSIDGSDLKQVKNEPILPCSRSGSKLYYTGVTGDHNIYSLDTTTDTSTVVYAGNSYNPVIVGSYAYMMDPDQNYALSRVDLSTGEKTILSKDRLDCFNIYGNMIYYQKSSTTNPGLYRIDLEGNNLEKIMDGIYTNINITSRYVYFYSYENDKTCYLTPTNGPVQVTEFLPPVQKD